MQYRGGYPSSSVRVRSNWQKMWIKYPVSRSGHCHLQSIWINAFRRFGSRWRFVLRQSVILIGLRDVEKMSNDLYVKRDGLKWSKAYKEDEE
jgi:hypothetical protein